MRIREPPKMRQQLEHHHAEHND
ncbi:TPA: PadR family transcriptional regulator, partial [Acinetobacter baumannii]|nr:PadR family transcriptional regulator [Acinetobacter baumannii]